MPIVRRSEIDGVVSSAFNTTKGMGPRRLAITLRKRFVGLGEKSIQRSLATNITHQARNARFCNNVPITPVVSSKPMGRLQIDLVDFSRRPSSTKGVSYRYILSVLDVHSRYTWLRPLRTKSSHLVSNELQKLFDTYGYPAIIQHDRGGEFRGEVTSLLKKHRVKDISSSAYHPQSQGKVERMHSSLKRMIRFDEIKGECSWASNLANYEMLLNDAPKECLKYMTPFETFFYRARHAKKENTSETLPEEIRQQVQKATTRVNKRTIKQMEKKMRVPTFDKNDNVFVRQFDGARKKSRVAPGKVIDIDPSKYRYLIKIGNHSKWTNVRNISGSSVSVQRKAAVSSVPTTTADNPFAAQGFNISFNPLGNGNCQFDSISHIVSPNGTLTGSLLRQRIVDYLGRVEYLGTQRSTRWESHLIRETRGEFLIRMGNDATYGDEITLQAAASLLNTQIIIISTLDNGNVALTPDGTGVLNLNMPYITLGHYAEDDGIHYVALESTDSNNLRDLLTSRSPQIRIESDTDAIPSQPENQPSQTVDNDMQSSSLLNLPPELLTMIIRYAITSGSLLDRQRIQCVSRIFQEISQGINFRFPKIHIAGHLHCDLGLDHPFVRGLTYETSVMKFIKVAGKGSGLVAEIQWLIQDPRWLCHYLFLAYVAHNMFEVRRVYRKK